MIGTIYVVRPGPRGGSAEKPHARRAGRGRAGAALSCEVTDQERKLVEVSMGQTAPGRGTAQGIHFGKGILMKWLVRLAMGALLITIAVITTGCTSGGQKASIPTTATPRTTAPPASPTTAPRAYSATEIASHASTTSCWLLIDKRVYDVTRYLSHHPSGIRTITPWCGKEATKAFATAAGRGKHSPAAYDDLKTYFIGVLVTS